MSLILGISCFYHDSAVTLIKDEKIIFAAQEERFSRIKHDSSFPKKSIQYLLKNHNISLNNLESIVFYEKPFLKFERLLETYIAFAPKGFKSFCASIPIWLREKLFQKKLIISELKKIDQTFNPFNKVKFSEHHLSHAASAFYPSPFEEAAILTLDGVGEWATTTIAYGKNNKIKMLEEIHFPHSLGLLYSAFTYYLGFKVNSGEYKVMGLAPYGEPKYKELIYKNLIDVKPDGSFKLNMNFFEFATGLKMTNTKFSKLFGKKVRTSEIEQITQFHMDVASSIQVVIEEIILKIVRNLKKKLNINNLCLAGGVALNCVANGKILREKIFENIWIQPAAGDAGGSLGAALTYLYDFKKHKRTNKNVDSMEGSFLGPIYSDIQIKEELIKLGASFEELSEEKLLNETVEDIISEKAIGWFQGKMEFGPRALGNRSIIADPRSINMQKNLNLKVKYRESFRPFAPSILRESLSNYFNLNCDSPYMLLVASVNDKIKKEMNDKEKQLFGIEKLNVVRSNIPAVTHVDYSSRIQTVDKNTNEKFYNLISHFNNKTNCPLLVNTSFNIRGEPIVNTVEDAFKCFMGTGLDTLVIGNFILRKNKQNLKFDKEYKDKYNLD
jgi:carbamoyltransferase